MQINEAPLKPKTQWVIYEYLNLKNKLWEGVQVDKKLTLLMLRQDSMEGGFQF